MVDGEMEFGRATMFDSRRAVDTRRERRMLARHRLLKGRQDQLRLDQGLGHKAGDRKAGPKRTQLSLCG